MFSTYLWISTINGIGDPVFQTSNILLNLWMEDADHVCQWWLKRLLWNCSSLSMSSWISRNGRQEVVVLILEQKSTAVDKSSRKVVNCSSHSPRLWALCFDSEYDLRWWKRYQDVEAFGRQTCSSSKMFGLYLYKLNLRDFSFCYLLVVAEREESILWVSLDWNLRWNHHRSPRPNNSDIPQLLGLELSSHVPWLEVWQAAWSAEAKSTKNVAPISFSFVGLTAQIVCSWHVTNWSSQLQAVDSTASELASWEMKADAEAMTHCISSWKGHTSSFRMSFHAAWNSANVALEFWRSTG